MTPKRIIITGATGGLGRALVREYAQPGVSFLLFGRNEARLEAARKDAMNAGANAETHSAPVDAFAEMEAAFLAFYDAGAVDLVLLCAGVKTGNRDGVEPDQQLARVLSVNLDAPIRHAQSILPRLRAHDRGQIVFFSSLAALSPQADILSYSATKSAIRTYGTALRRALRGTGVTIHVVTPGFIDTPMTDRHLGLTPMKLSPERSARIIRRGLARNRAEITFPWLLGALIRIENMLPAALADRINRAFRAEIVPDADEQAAKDQSQG